jgi:aryl-alcohol dehydrogenase-like predicted oxidoreductase
LDCLRRDPVVAAPIVGALKTMHIDNAVAALSITLTDDEVARLKAPYEETLWDRLVLFSDNQTDIYFRYR